MIYEDHKDWSNTEINYSLRILKYKTNIKNCNNITVIFPVFLYKYKSIEQLCIL